VQLEQIDPIGFQTFQRSIRGACDSFGRKILRDFALPSPARLAVMYKIVADLCCNHDFVPLIWEGLGDQFFTQPVAVRISRIKQSDAEIERLVHEGDRFAFGEISPPASGNRPQTKPDLAHRQLGALVRTEVHNDRVTTEHTEVTEKNMILCPCAL
jgi:hypothetical protein